MKFLIPLVLVALVLGGCNTIGGLGRDIAAAADGMGKEYSRQYGDVRHRPAPIPTTYTQSR